MACFEQNPSTGAGMTEYLLSRGNQNNPYPLNMPDSEGCECDGNTSGSDFEPQSQGPSPANF